MLEWLLAELMKRGGGRYWQWSRCGRRRRSRVEGVFPSVASYLRLVTCYLIEYMEDWANDYAYIKADKLGSILEQEKMLAAN